MAGPIRIDVFGVIRRILSARPSHMVAPMSAPKIARGLVLILALLLFAPSSGNG